MAFVLPEIPYDESALEPHISHQTLHFHHKKHHAAYVNNLNNAIAGSPSYEGKDLEGVIVASQGKPEAQGIFNNAAQVWNHDFYWHSMKQEGGGKPPQELLDKINADFGGYDKFVAEFKDAGVKQFGSGWAWLVYDIKSKKLKVLKTLNADCPLGDPSVRPLMAMDVWEHAYYLDYQNRRPDYIATFIDKLVNWDFAYKNYSGS